MSEILAWCATEHLAGYLALQKILKHEPHRGFVVEAHDEQALDAYREVGFTSVYRYDQGKWHKYHDTLALV